MPSRPLHVVIGLGANVGDRLVTLRNAADRLVASYGPARRSHVYATAPVGPPQPDFLNAAIELTAEATPHDLLATLLSIEAALGRVRRERWGPRTIDLDILWIEDLSVATPELTVPHARLRERAFALAPMLELVPGARDPRTGSVYELPPGDIRRLDEVL